MLSVYGANVGTAGVAQDAKVCGGWSVPLRSFLCKTAIRGRFANDMTGKSPSCLQNYTSCNFGGTSVYPRPAPPATLLCSPNLADLVRSHSIGLPIECYNIVRWTILACAPATLFFCTTRRCAAWWVHPWPFWLVFLSKLLCNFGCTRRTIGVCSRAAHSGTR